MSDVHPQIFENIYLLVWIDVKVGLFIWCSKVIIGRAPGCIG